MILFVTIEFVVSRMQKAQSTCSDIDNDWKKLECTAAEILASCETEEDQQVITDRLAPVQTQLAEVKENVKHKAAVYALLVERVQTRTVVEERLLNIRQRLKDDEVTVSEMAELRSDLGTTRRQLLELDNSYPEMEALMSEAGLVVKSHKMEDVVNLKADTEQLLCEVEKDDKTLKVCEEIATVDGHLHEAESQLNELNVVYTDDLQSLASAVEVSIRVLFIF